MAKDFFETMLDNGVLNEEFFKTIDDLTKNIQSTIHTIQEKYENGQLVEKNEEKFENGKKTLDVHETVTNTLDNKCDKQNDTCKCTNACASEGKIAVLEKNVKNLEEELEQWRNAYFKALSEKEALEDKFSTIKSLFK